MTTETIHGLLFYFGVFSTGYGVGLLFIDGVWLLADKLAELDIENRRNRR